MIINFFTLTMLSSFVFCYERIAKFLTNSDSV